MPDDLEPGLSDRQLTQVLLNSMSLEDWQADSAATTPEGDAPQGQAADQGQCHQPRAARSKRNIADVSGRGSPERGERGAESVPLVRVGDVQPRSVQLC